MLKRLRNLVSPPAIPAVEQRAALLAGKNVSYTLKRSRRRSIGLRIDGRGLIVSAPLRVSEKWLHSVLQDKAQWVIEKLDDWQSRKPREVRWADGELVPFLGERLVLCVRQSLFAAPVQQRGRELWVFVADDSDAAHIEQLVLRWHREQAGPLFAERVAHYAPLLNVAPRTVKLSAAKTQWGSCTARGAVRLNEQLIRLPLRLIDYVVVHELAHLREMNHSAAFWNVVGSACPDYAKLRRELKSVGL
ncbi:M48 family metallopeptidase [Candidatus Ferrigenium straubiae]|uniref:M48 family metallopeptidase n=1 Tax=Candidatus Ferrigenium straubiae TaxID=2919506 RepID=UPI003F4AF77F